MTHADDVGTMDVPEDADEIPGSRERTVSVHECSPERAVFTENGNSEGWIATDTTVDLLR